MIPPFSDMYDDVYFSAHDGLAEKRHVFLTGNDLPSRFSDRDRFTIFEAGFGTGLSFLAAAQAFLQSTQPHQNLYFYSVEAHPMTGAQIRTALGHWASDLGGLIDELVAAWPMTVPGCHQIIIGARVHLTLMIGDIQDVLPLFDTPVDAWFLDGFTPAKNPAMWNDTVFEAMRRCSATGATAATYSAARMVKDGLARAGFDAQKAKGFGYKSDMTRARFLGAGRDHYRAMRSGQRTLILGGGLAGTACAWALKQAGHIPVIVAPNGLADGASGNARGLYNPRFSVRFTPMARFYTNAFAAFHRFLSGYDPQVTGWQATGALHLIRNDQTREKLYGAAQNWGWGPERLKIVDAQQASDIAGIPLAYDALWLPDGGSVDPRKICGLYAEGIEVRTDCPLFDAYDHVVAANGFAAQEYPGLSGLPLRSVRGQVIAVPVNDQSAYLKTHLCYGGYIAPAVDGTHVVGATFTRDDTGIDIRPADTDEILQRAATHTGLMFDAASVTSARAGVRATTPDHFPMVGQVQMDERRSTSVSLAHGSHGLLSTHLGALSLAGMIGGVPIPLGPDVYNMMDPNRFQKG